MKANGTVFKYGDNVDTDVIIPARYLNSSDPAELATHCMEDIDQDFVKKVRKGDMIVANKNFGCGSSREHAPIEMCIRDRYDVAPGYMGMCYFEIPTDVLQPLLKDCLLYTSRCV